MAESFFSIYNNIKNPKIIKTAVEVPRLLNNYYDKLVFQT